MIDDNAEFLHHGRSGGSVSLYRVRHTLDTIVSNHPW